jgi:pimeloyl-ACP methyl ester carboxylesterase
MDHQKSEFMAPFHSLAAYAEETQLPSGLRMFHFTAGDPCKHPILLVHGLGDEADTWRHLIEPLAKSYYVIAPDLPGFGRSDLLGVRYTFESLANSLLELLSVHKIHEVHLVGSSLGAMLVQWIALRKPEIARSLTLIDGSLLIKKQPLSLQMLLFLTPGLGEWLYTRLSKYPDQAYATLRPYYADIDQLPKPERDFLYKRVQERVSRKKQRQAYFSTLRALASSVSSLQKELPAQLSSLQTPTLVIWGEKDAINPIENAHALVKVQTKAHIAQLPGAGHLPHQESPEAVLQVLLEMI